jgi:hypothetical protein
MDLSLFTGQTVDVRLKNQTVYESVKLAYTRNAGYTLNPAPRGTHAVYSSKGTDLTAPVAEFDIQDIQFSKPQFQDIQFSKPQFYTMDRSELLNTIAETKRQLTELEAQLDLRPIEVNEALVGDVLADGSEVIQKWPGGALLAAPAWFNWSTNVHTNEPDFEGYLDSLGTKLNRWGYNRWDWFIPTAELLQMAFGKLELNNPNRVPYWTSSKKIWGLTSRDKAGKIRAFGHVAY